MTKSKTSPAFWDKIAAKYASDPVRDESAYQHTLERTKSYLLPSDHVLELGAGTGSTAILLAPGVGHITASDYSANMLEQARAKPEVAALKNLTFVQADVFDPILTDRSYDAVLAHSLIHLVPDTPKLLDHINGLLKPGGMFISKTACLGGRGWVLRLIRMVIPIAKLLGKAPFVNVFSPHELQEMVRAAGFDIVETGDYPAGPPPAHYIVAKKR